MVTHDPPAGVEDHARAHGPSDSDPRLEKWEQRFFWPVLIAALASVPAVFLTVMFDPPWEIAGEVVNHISMVVFAAETVVLLVLAPDKRRWVRDHWHIVAITGLTIPAVLLAVGPVQALRALRPVVQGVMRLGALRIIRVGRILKAGKILYNRTDLSGPVRKGIALGATLLAAVFVALVLSDPSAETWTLLSDLRGEVRDAFGGAWIYVVLFAGLILAGATFVLFRVRREPANDQSHPPPTESASEREK